MEQKEKLKELRNLIDQWFATVKEAEILHELWKQMDDPDADSSVQWVKETEIDYIYEKIKNLTKEL